jgi:hypothetical protein
VIPSLDAWVLTGIAGAFCWSAWRLATGPSKPPSLPELGDYEATLSLPPSGAIQRKRQHDGRK